MAQHTAGIHTITHPATPLSATQLLGITRTIVQAPLDEDSAPLNSHSFVVTDQASAVAADGDSEAAVGVQIGTSGPAVVLAANPSALYVVGEVGEKVRWYSESA